MRGILRNQDGGAGVEEEGVREGFILNLTSAGIEAEKTLYGGRNPYLSFKRYLHICGTQGNSAYGMQGMRRSRIKLLSSSTPVLSLIT